MGNIDREDVMTAAGIVKKRCLSTWKTKQFVSACAKTTDRMTKELLARGPEITPQAVAQAANATEKKCDSYKTGQYGKICVRVVTNFIRQLAQKKPGLQGR